MATGLGGLFSGLSEGFQTGWKFGEKMEARDKKRRAAELSKLISDTQNDYTFGRGAFKEQDENSSPSVEQPVAEAPRGVTPPPNDAGVIVRPFNPPPPPVEVPLPEDGSTPAPTPAPAPRGLTGTQSGAAVSAAPELRGVQQPAVSITEENGVTRATANEPIGVTATKEEPKNPVEAMFKTRYKNPKAADDLLYSRLNDYYTELYTVTEQYDKIPQVRTMLRDMREKEFEPRKRIGAALIGTGNAEGFKVLGEAASIAGLDFQVDASKATYDPKTMNWDGLVMVQGGKKSQPFNASVEQLWQQLSAITPAEAISMRLSLKKDSREDEKLGMDREELGLKRQEFGLKQEEQGRKGRETDAQIQYWKDVISTKKQEIKAKLEEVGVYKSAQTLNQATQASSRAYQSIGSALGLAKEYKPEELALMNDQEKRTYLADRGDKMELAGAAHNLWQMNNFGPDGSLRTKMPESVAIAIARMDINDILSNSSSNGDGTRTLNFRGKQYLVADVPSPRANAAPGNDPNARYSRTKNRDGSYSYVPDPKGLTRSQWTGIDKSGIPE